MRVSSLAMLTTVVLACSSSESTPPVVDSGVEGGTSTSTLLDPDAVILLDGAQVPKLLGADPVAAFRWDGAGFTEVALQIDPREVRPFSDAMSPNDPRKPLATGATTSFYTDSNLAPGGDGTTYVGVDHDPKFDADDELVVAATDFGGRAPDGAAPTGVNAGTRTELHATHEGDATRSGYLYLFTRGAAGTPFANAVTMTVKFPANPGDFKSFYVTNAGDSTSGTARACGGGNWGVEYPEDTTIASAAYRRHFSGRWISDEMRVLRGGDHGDLLDIHEVRPAIAEFTGEIAATTAASFPANTSACGRSTTTFSGGPGTIVTLRSGPLRAIRSYFGANSGTITQRAHFFYAGKEDVYTYLRVHPIAGAADGLDLAPAAKGMTYFNEHNSAGFAVDGQPDVYDRTFASWEMVTGDTQGTLLSIHRKVLVDLGPSSNTTYAPQMMWLDAGKTTCVCAGTDDELVGLHGVAVRDPARTLPNTDPLRGDAGQVFFLRSIAYLDGKKSASDAMKLASDATTLVVSIDGGKPVDPYAITCGDGVCEANETSANCDSDCKPLQGAAKCGDGQCIDGEAYICLKDCPPSAHGPYFGCLDASCPIPYAACGSDPGCIDSLKCLEACTDTYAKCEQTCVGAITDAGSLQIAKALAQCSNSKCMAQF
ncbi:hypothetical protein BH09MYX1_BH09MYX1_09600 [soil metagenome]